MKTVERLKRWKETGAITGAQFDTIAAVVRKDRFSVFIELNVLLYLGVLFFIGGLAWTIQTYFASLGDAAIIVGLSAILAASLYYCFSRAAAYSNRQVESPNIGFDYVLYLACLVLASELAYIESRFQLLQENRDYYLLFSAFLYFVFAYRFDNRLVLSLALSTLAAWFGLKISRFGLDSIGSVRAAAIGYGVVVAGAGAWLSRQGIKKHFLEAYLHIAANVLFIAFLSGVLEKERLSFYFLGLLAVSAASIGAGIRFRRFAFLVYGTIYGYIGISAEVLLRVAPDLIGALVYFLISGAFVIILIVVLARGTGRYE